MIEAIIIVRIKVEVQETVDYAVANIQSNMDYDNIESEVWLLTSKKL